MMSRNCSRKFCGRSNHTTNNKRKKRLHGGGLESVQPGGGGNEAWCARATVSNRSFRSSHLNVIARSPSRLYHVCFACLACLILDNARTKVVPRRRTGRY